MDGKNWKISFRVRYPYNATTENVQLFYNYTSSSDRVYLLGQGVGFYAARIRSGGTDASSVSITPEAGREYHIEIVSNSSGFRLFVDGEPGNLDTDDVAHIPSLKMELGNQDSGNSVRVPVQITDFRYTDATTIQCNIMAVTGKVYSGSAATVGAGPDITVSVAALADQVEASAASNAIRTAQVAADVASVEAACASVLRHKASVGVGVELCDTTCQPGNWSGANSSANGDGTISFFAGGGYATATSSPALVIGKQYLVTMTVTASAGGAGAMQGLVGWGTSYTSAGTYTQVLTATTTDKFGVGFVSDAGTISGISIKEVYEDYMAPVEASASTKASHIASVDATLYTRTQTNTDPDCDSATGWALQNCTVTGGELVFPGDGVGGQSAGWPGASAIRAGKRYQVTVRTGDATPTGGFAVWIGNTVGLFVASASANTTYQGSVFAPSEDYIISNTYFATAGNTTVLDVDYLSIEEVEGVSASANTKTTHIASVDADVTGHSDEINPDVPILVEAEWNMTNAGAIWSWESGALVCSGFQSAQYVTSNNVDLETGKTYDVTYTITDYTGGSFRIYLGFISYGPTRSANGTYTDRITVSTLYGNGRDLIAYAPTLETHGYKVTNISLKEVTGVQASASSTSIHKASVGSSFEILADQMQTDDTTASGTNQDDWEWASSNVSITSGKANHLQGIGSFISTKELAIQDAYYQITYTIENEAMWIAQLGGNSLSAAQKAVGTHTVTFKANNSVQGVAVFNFPATNGSTCKLSNVSLRQLSPIEAVEASASADRTIIASVAADAPQAEASASAKSVHVATVAAETGAVTASADATWSSGFNTYQAAVAADAPATVAAAVSRFVRTASVDAEVVENVEICTDPTITPTGWSVSGGATIDAAGLHFNNSGSEFGYWPGHEVVGFLKTYHVTITIENITTGSIIPVVGAQNIGSFTTNGTHEGYLQATTELDANNYIVGVNTDGDVTYFSVKEVTGVTASASAGVTHTASVAADTPSVTASATARQNITAAVAANTPTVEASAVSTVTRKVSVAAEVGSVKASSYGQVIHKASVAADVPSIESSSHLTKGAKNAQVAAVTGAVTATASVKVTHVAAVAADVPTVEASATTRHVYTASVDATIGAVTAGQASQVTHHCSVAADVPSVSASATTKTTHIASIDAEVTGVQASASTKTTHIAAVAAEVPATTASAVARGKAVASVAADVPAVTATATTKTTHIATVAAEIGSVTASATAGVTHIASVDADVPATEASASLSKGQLLARVVADVPAVTASAAATVTHIAVVTADTPSITASAVAHYVRTASIDADVPAITASAASKSVHVAAVAADTGAAEASATSKSVHITSVDADIASVESSAASKVIHKASVDADAPATTASAVTKATHIASVAAEIASVESSAASKSVHIASVVAETGSVICSNETRFSAYSTVTAVTPVTEASAATKVIHKATVAADVAKVEASSSTKVTHTAAVAAETGAVTASAAAKRVRIAAINADVPAITASSTTKATHIAAVSAEAGSVTASATTVVIHIASVDVDVPSVEANVKVRGELEVLAVVPAVTASASAKVIHIASVAADTPSVEASATSHYVRTASVTAAIAAITATASNKVTHIAAVDAAITAITATASAKAVHVAAVAADTQAITASAGARKLGANSVAANAPTVEASAAAKVIHTAAIDADVPSIQASVTSRRSGNITVAADVGSIEASVTAKVIHTATVDAVTGSVFAGNASDVLHIASVAAVTAPVEASASTAGIRIANVDAVVTVGASASAKVIHTASVAAEIASIVGYGRFGGGNRVEAAVAQVTATAAAKVIHTAAVDAVLTPVDASVNTRVESVFDPNAVTVCTTWTLAARPTTWTLSARPTIWTVAKRSTNWIIKCRNTVYRLFCK